jgi:hypothetical protein
MINIVYGTTQFDDGAVIHYHHDVEVDLGKEEIALKRCPKKLTIRFFCKTSSSAKRLADELHSCKSINIVPLENRE